MRISRLETTTNNTFVRLDSLTKPVYVERFISNDKNLQHEIEDMAADLQLLEDAYVAPEVAVSKTEEERETVKATLRADKIAAAKAKKIKDKEEKI